MHAPARAGNPPVVTESEEYVATIARAATRRGLVVAAAESLTCGLISSRLGAGPEASTWFRGSVVAYQEPVKFEVLGVDEGPVVTAECAEQMARGVAHLLGADTAVAVTGVGGPDPSEGEAPGTVYVAVLVGEALTVHRVDLAGDDPERILHVTADRTIAMLAEALSD